MAGVLQAPVRRPSFIVIAFGPGLVAAVVALSPLLFAGGDTLPESGADWPVLVTWAQFARQSLLEYGHVPLWNPYECSGGNVFLAHFEAAWALNPLVLPFLLVFDLATGIKLAILAHYVLGFLGAYLLVHQLTLKPLAALFGAFFFAFNSGFAAHIYAGHLHWIGLFYAPWIFYFLFRLREEPRAMIGAAVFMSLLATGGQAAYGGLNTGIALGVVALVSCAVEKSWRPLGALTGLFFLTLALSCWKILPVALHLAGIPDQAPMSEEYALADLAAFFIQPQRMVGALTYDFKSHAFFEGTHFVGVPGLVVFVAACVLARSEVKAYLVVVAALFSVALGTTFAFAPYRLLGLLPVLEHAHVSVRMLDLVLLFMALICGVFLSRFESPWTTSAAAFLRDNALLLIFLAGFAGLLVQNSYFYFAGMRAATPPPGQAAERLFARYDVAQIRSESFAVLPIEDSSSYTTLEAVRHNKGYFACEGDSRNIGYGRAGSPGPLLIDGPAGGARLVAWTPGSMSIQAESEGSTVLRINQNYHEHWRSESGHELVDASGRLGVVLAPGRQLIRLRFEPPFTRFAFLFSQLTALLFGVLYFRSGLRRSKPKP